MTSDGYINTLHRVYKDHPYKEVLDGKYAKRVQKPVVVMVHGLEDSADGWVLNGEGKSPAFVVAKQGYDVWIPNARGNYYSRGHVRLNATTDAQYWDFTISDIALNDMPAFIKFIRWKVSLQDNQKVSLLAHSQGNTQLLYGMSKHPEFYQENVDSLIALGPITRPSGLSPLNEILLGLIVGSNELLELAGIYDQ